MRRQSGRRACFALPTPNGEEVNKVEEEQINRRRGSLRTKSPSSASQNLPAILVPLLESSAQDSRHRVRKGM